MSDKNHVHRDCIEMFEKLSEYVDDELDQSACDEIKKHANRCIPCKTCLEMLRQTKALCKKIKNQPVSDSFSTHLKDVIDKMIEEVERRH